MNAPESVFLPDVQSMPDHRSIAIDRAGIRGLRHPVTIKSAGRGSFATIAMVDMSVALPAELKGTHMSRFLEVLQAHDGALDVTVLPELMGAMLQRLDAHAGALSLRFAYFVMKRAPVSGVRSLMDYEVCLRATGAAGNPEIVIEVGVPVTSLCPCSKEMSEYGAHNQRSVVSIAATLAWPLEVSRLDPETLITMAESAASCELYGLLKRPDEKFVTERAYDNPKFVEDLVRDVALELERDARIAAYRVESENFESIHNHSAYAAIERDKRLP
jgi:GTP cyclohydrolase I